MDLIREEGSSRRAEVLLFEHLDPAQRSAYRSTKNVRVVKDGVIWNVVLRYAILALLPVAGFAVPGSGAWAALSVLVVLLAFLSIQAPSLRIACCRHRVWEITGQDAPRLYLGGRARPIRFCVQLDADLPPADRMLAYKNILEVNESYFLRKANARL